MFHDIKLLEIANKKSESFYTYPGNTQLAGCYTKDRHWIRRRERFIDLVSGISLNDGDQQ